MLSAYSFDKNKSSWNRQSGCNVQWIFNPAELVDLKNVGVFISKPIKKQPYWPRYVKVDDIKTRFNRKDTGCFDENRGESKYQPFKIYVMKEPDDVPLLMNTYGSESSMGR